MLTSETKHKIDSARDILVGKVPDPKAQVEQITNALIYKFMDDMDQESIELGGKPRYFTNGFEKYAWNKLMDPKLGGLERLDLYVEALTRMSQNPHLPQLFRDIFKDSFLPYRDPETLNLFLKQINEFTYHHSEELGNSFEYLLSVLGSQGDAGQFRTPRHIIDFIVGVVDPKKTDRILDPACGTAGFLISAYKHILASHDGKDNTSGKRTDTEIRLTPDERKRLVKSVVGYDISPDMVKLSRVNMYLHGFPEPHIFEYDSLSSEDKWDDSFDIILANPPFMTPKGGIRPHKRFSVQANRSEVLFVDYIAEHLTSNGRAGVIVPEGIIFQSGNAYKQLRKMLVENYLYAVVSLPAGVFQPYSGVKTSILFFDPDLAKRSKNVLFVKIENDGRTLGSQRHVQDGNQLDPARSLIAEFCSKPDTTSEELKKTAKAKPLFTIGKSLIGGIDAIGNPGEIENLQVEVVNKEKIAEAGEFNLSAGLYAETMARGEEKWPMVELDSIADLKNGLWTGKKPPYTLARVIRNTNFTKMGELNLNNVAEIEVEKRHLQDRRLEYGDIILENSGGSPAQPVGRVVFFDLKDQNNYSYSNFTSRIRVTDSSVSPKFLWYILNYLYQSGFTNNLQNQTSGIRNLDKKTYVKVAIPHPPIEVQKEIVAELDGYQKIVDGARQVIENYKPIVKVNPNWAEGKLGDYVDVFSGYAFKSSLFNSAGEGTPLIRIRDVKPNRTKTYYSGVYDEKYLVHNGDLLVGMDGEFNPVIWRGGDALLNQRVCRIENFRGLLPHLAIEILRNELKKIEASTYAVTVKHISAKQIKDILIKVPPPEDQKRIVGELETEQKLITGNKGLIEIYTQKIKDKIAEVWC